VVLLIGGDNPRMESQSRKSHIKKHAPAASLRNREISISFLTEAELTKAQLVLFWQNCKKPDSAELDREDDCSCRMAASGRVGLSINREYIDAPDRKSNE
jgi:hypothetical protein